MTYIVMINDITKWLILCTALLLGGCVQEVMLPGTGTVTDGKVRIDLYANGINYDKPIARTGTSQEELDDNNPWVLVFYGEGNNAVFAEAQQAIYSGGKSYVMLNAYASKCRVAIIGNTPAKFFDGASLWDFNLANLNTVLSGKRFDLAMNTLLQTELLDSPEHSLVPYTDVDGKLPMTAIVDLNSITGSTKFGTESDKLQLKRVVAKVVVSDESGSGDFVFYSATVTNTARNGRFWELGTRPRSNAGNLVSYYGPGANRSLQVNNIARANASKTTSDNPIYIYETRKEEGTSVIVRGGYMGVAGFYRLLFKGADGNPVDIFRNKFYKIRIKSVNTTGYPTPDEAMLHEPSDAITYDIDVVDQSSYEIADNGEYYLGLSHSEVEIQWFDALTLAQVAGYFSDEPALTITTNAPAGTSTSITAACTESIPQLGSNPQNGILYCRTTGPSNTGINTAGTPVTTEVRVYFNRYFQAGRLTIRVGNLTKQVNVRRTGRLSTAAFTQPFTPTEGGYVSGEIERGSQWFRIGFSTDRANSSIKASSSNVNGETLYMFGDDYFSTYADRFRTGTATFVRSKDARRVKLYMEQVSSQLKYYFCYVATFHRYNQTGERIILMEGTDFDSYGHVPTVGTWTATIINGADFINIDKNKLGRDINDPTKAWGAENPENNQVSNGGTTISGVCDALNPIYFRIGLKSTIGATETRFGAVLLTYNNGAQNSVIFVRQGETPVEIVGSAKWSVYNLSDPDRSHTGLANGGMVLSDFNLMTPQRTYVKETFTDYPTQIGYLYQWGVTVYSGGKYKRYAFHSSFPRPGTSISGYPTIRNTYTWDTAADPCPKGYRSPSPVHINPETGLAQYTEEPSPAGDGRIVYTHNSLWGYCADGYFDRLPLDKQYSHGAVVGMKDNVGDTGNSAATVGRVFFNPNTLASVFFPAAAYREPNGNLQSLGASNAQYMTTTEYLMAFGANSMSTKGEVGDGVPARPIRCIKE